MNASVARLRAYLRQQRHHRAFRIAPPAWDEDQLTLLERAVAELEALRARDGADAGDGDEEAGPDAPGGEELDTRRLTEAANNLWRAQKKLERAEDSSKEARQAGRLLRNSRTALDEAGLVIQDHDGTVFHPGLSLEALVFQDDPSLSTETVLETVRPSIYFRDRRIQMGQVIVGRPVDQEHPEGDDHA